jgi:hypothetical protein
MKTASGISKPRASTRRSTASRRPKKVSKVRPLPNWKLYEAAAPPNPRGRKREAGRWLDVLDARTTNGPPKDYRPGAVYIPIKEGWRMHEAAITELEVRDPGLYKAVRRVRWERMVADIGISLEEWKVQAVRRVQKLVRIRALLPPL